MNDKKYSLKKILAAFLMILPLAGCTQTPEEVGGQPVKVVETYLLYPLEISTDKEQQLYFRFKRQPDSNTKYLISAVVILPSISSNDKEYEKYDNLNKKLIKEKMLSFELLLIHYNHKGKATPVSLSQYIGLANLEESKATRIVSNGKNFEGFLASYTGNGVESGYDGTVNGLATFTVPEKGGYYRLSLRTLKQYHDYPKMKLAVDISPEYTGK